MKKTPFFVWVALFLSAAVLLVLGGCKTVKTENNGRTMSSSSGAYTVREYGGKIAVFESGNRTPDYVLESPLVRDLPMKDREKLSAGISAADQKELDGILQDYDN